MINANILLPESRKVWPSQMREQRKIVTEKIETLPIYWDFGLAATNSSFINIYFLQKKKKEKKTIWVSWIKYFLKKFKSFDNIQNLTI